MPDEFVNMLAQGLHFDSPNLQDSFIMALWRIVSQANQIGLDPHAV